MSLGKGLSGALGFLTVLPLASEKPSPEALEWFPFVGACIGALVGKVWQGAAKVWPSLPGAVLVVASEAAITGGLHWDGLADTADGLLAHMPAKRRLEIMAEPEVGTFGAIAVALGLCGRLAGLSTTTPNAWLLPSTCAASRSVAVLALQSLPYARPHGLAGDFTQGEQNRLPAIAGLVGSAMVVSIFGGRRSLADLATGIGCSVGVLLASRRRIGGYTGDILGAAIVTCETVTLLMSSRRR